LAVKILSGVARLKGRFGLRMAVKVLVGSKDRLLMQFGLQQLSTYGLLSGFTQLQVQEWIREMMAEGCITSRRNAMGGKQYPVLELTERGYRVMAGKDVIRLSQIREQGALPLQAPSLR
jgi:ATP-dependent DNA helicase RecQ